jgi:hypothetical protein
MLRVFKNTALRGRFGPEEDVKGNWRKLHTEEFHDVYTIYIIQVIKSRGMRGVGHVELWKERRNIRFGGEVSRKETTGTT